jgi:hypothetical protein
MSEKSAAMIEVTRLWVAELVIGDNLCPFARGLLDDGRLEIRVSEQGTLEALLHTLARECRRLAQVPASELETTLLLHPGTLESFEEQLDFLPAIEALLEQLDLDDALQVVSFHPDYRFADAPEDDPANYTNRAPFGMFHLLRRRSMAGAIASHPDPDSIWRRNVELLRDRGGEVLEARLAELRALAKASP